MSMAALRGRTMFSSTSFLGLRPSLGSAAEPAEVVVVAVLELSAGGVVGVVGRGPGVIGGAGGGAMLGGLVGRDTVVIGVPRLATMLAGGDSEWSTLYMTAPPAAKQPNASVE